jgi:hypothetical protein
MDRLRLGFIARRELTVQELAEELKPVPFEFAVQGPKACESFAVMNSAAD